MTLLHSLRHPQLIGVYTALVTPFTRSGAIDWKSFDRLIDHQIDGQVSGVVICGTTGETPTLSDSEKKQLIRRAKKRLSQSALHLIVGTGGNSTAETLEFSTWACDVGVDALLVVTPYYNKPTQAGLELHYDLISKKVTAPIILYNVPGRTGVSLQAATVAKLALNPKIVAIKEASGTLTLGSDILGALKKNTRINLLSGDDPIWVPSLLTGACGVISVASNLIPREMNSAFQSFLSQDLSALSEFQRRFYPLFRDLFIESNPTPIKTLLEHEGLCASYVRPPLTSLARLSQSTLLNTWKACSL
jgi:4-hydroxy-tetrahydrodipicolinate synthase